jgi:hypothetical protein
MSTTTQLISRLTDAFEFMMDKNPEPSLSLLGEAETPANISECVPLMAIVLELIARGPTTISIEGVESYRGKIMHLLEHIRPVIEQEAKQSLADWTLKLAAEPQQRRAA